MAQFDITNPFSFMSLLGSSVFTGCTNLEEIKFESVYESTVSLPENITSIGEGAFQNNYSITKVNINSNITSLPPSFFQGSNNIIKLDIASDTITSIGENALAGISVQNLTIPSSVTNIESGAIADNPNLQTITFLGTNIQISEDAFIGTIVDNNNGDVLVVTNFDDNNVIANFFKETYPEASVAKIGSVQLLDKLVEDIYYLLNDLQRPVTGVITELPDNILYSFPTIRNYVRPTVNIILNSNQDILNTDILIPGEIPTDKKTSYRRLILNFIFENNPNYRSFIIKANLLNLEVPTFQSTDVFIKVYKMATNYMNVTEDILINNINTDVVAIYGLLDDVSYNYSEGYLNQYKIRIYLDESNNSINFKYSTNNFVEESYGVLQGTNAKSLTNYYIKSNGNFDFFIYKNSVFNNLNFYLDDLLLDITMNTTATTEGKITPIITADAYSNIKVPLSLFLQTFMYQSDAIDMIDYVPGTTYEDIKYKTAYIPEIWTNFYPTKSTVYKGGITYYGKNTLNASNEINADYVRYLALKLFKTSNGADLFRNNMLLRNSLDALSNHHFKEKISEFSKKISSVGDFGQGILTDHDVSGNIPKIILEHIMSTEPERIIPSGEFDPLPLYSGDKISMKLIIHPHQDQGKIFRDRAEIEIPDRSYLIEFEFVSG